MQIAGGVAVLGGILLLQVESILKERKQEKT